MKNTGDSMLSSYDMRLWSLVQHVALRWATFVIFKSEHYSVPDCRRGYITFFVPIDATFRDEIVAFLEHELADLKSDGFPARGDLPAIPGTDVAVEVVAFSGVVPHFPRDDTERMVREALSTFMQRLKKDSE